MNRASVRADQDVDGLFDLRTIPASGGDPAPLSSGMRAVGPERP